ncbi:MAG: flagellar basal body rod protein FlgC [Pseudomonadota bacterium]
MSLFKVFDVAGTGMTAQTHRLNVVSSNLANADSATSSTGETYRAREVVFAAQPLQGGAPAGVAGVSVVGVVENQAPLRRVYDPGNPVADAQGYVTYPNVNPVEEMVNMISASRSYQANADVMNAAKLMLLKTLTIGQ